MGEGEPSPETGAEERGEGNSTGSSYRVRTSVDKEGVVTPGTSSSRRRG